ncbi:hypothetical protein [Magnetospirillum sp. UT-4]|uniref:hypothetical protein n=1 Tax=Magnetospirillum sp. UT-4 TaxID=2681467 RepID=UPI0013861C9F|nr:hypothetical protein [Magnetospirillum sp. UT-4]CAA7621698.1 putative PMT family glycosyltransferase, 4-amino-4-deoxy-L-arabinose transferase [Magnetospirillum sp. UT-4]
MTAALVLLAEFAASLGLGALLLRLLGLGKVLAGPDGSVFAFILGFGGLGWLVFLLGVPGLLTPVWLTLLLVAGIAATPLLRPALRGITPPRLDSIGWTLAMLLVAVASMDVAEALAPPTDADSLAYHFATPRRFVEAGRIEFILRPLDGAIPHLVQMTYIPALALGGERAMTFWVMVTGWMAVAMTFRLARPYLSLNWSLAAALLFATLPATVYAAGTGQVEVRMALFAGVAALAAGRAAASGGMGFAALAGLTTGFFVGSKYLGLLFAAMIGIVLLTGRRPIRTALVCAGAGLLAGGQWYVWNAIHTGDPAFPMFFQYLGKPDLGLWNGEQDAYFKSVYLESERPLRRSLFNLFFFPVLASVAPPAVTEARQVGFGPFGLLVLPVALSAAWLLRRSIRRGPMLSFILTCAGFYVLWFLTGTPQRLRFLLPVVPLLIVATFAAIHRVAALRPYLTAAVIVSLSFQFAVSGLFAHKYVSYLFTSETRQEYLKKHLLMYDAVSLVNSNVSDSDTLLISERQLLYYVHAKTLFASPHTQALIDLRPDFDDPAASYRQLVAAGITHVLIRGTEGPMPRLAQTDCLTLVGTTPARVLGSRTFDAGSAQTVDVRLFAVNRDGCLRN